MSQPIPFTKMHGIGNDFVVINALQQKTNLTPEKIRQLGNRHTGIGFDQLLLIERAKNADFYCRIYNSDGSEAEQCGNGLRCVARFLHESGVTKSESFILETKAGVYSVEIKDYEHIRVNMGLPDIDELLVKLSLPNSEETAEVAVLSMGNPHAIHKVANVQMVNAQTIGCVISTHGYFPRGANVGFMEIVTPNHIRLRTYERGAGETLACGSNACAAAIAGIKNGWLASSVQVEFSRGSLWVEWEGDGQSVYLTGPAEVVFKGFF